MCLSAFVSVLGSHEIECCNIQDKPQFPHLITILYILPLHQCPKKNDDIRAGRNASLEMRKRDDDEGTMSENQKATMITGDHIHGLFIRGKLTDW